MSILLLNATLVNEGRSQQADLLIDNQRIEKIGGDLQSHSAGQIFDLSGKWLLPGMIDDQVHFRSPGLTHKGDLSTESRAAIAGGITSFMDMPNVNPTTTTVERLQEKYACAEGQCFGNYAFYMGATNDNLEELKKVNKGDACGIKIFMGASTGNMLVDDEQVLAQIFECANVPIITHCEDTPTIKHNEEQFRQQYGEDIPIALHPQIRSAQACYISSHKAVELAKKYGTQLHVLHLTTEKELSLFQSGPVAGKNITLEVCVHHLFYSERDYQQRGGLIKCNPAIKSEADRQALIKAVASDTIDIIATDHAPHLLTEKKGTYFKIAAGLPLVQYALPCVLELVHDGHFTIEKLVEKTSHNVAQRFGVQERGYLREGYYADLTVVDPQQSCTDQPDKVLYKCGWSPFDGISFRSSIHMTLVNGTVVYKEGSICDPDPHGMRLQLG